MIRFKAHFDGEKLCPDEPVSLPEGVPLEVTAAEASDVAELPNSMSPGEMFAHIEKRVGMHEHPVDWSAEHDHYLHGAPKRNDDATDSLKVDSNPLDVFQQIEDECGLIDGPEDWAAEHDHYLYGTPKRAGGQLE